MSGDNVYRSTPEPTIAELQQIISALKELIKLLTQHPGIGEKP